MVEEIDECSTEITAFESLLESSEDWAEDLGLSPREDQAVMLNKMIRLALE